MNILWIEDEAKHDDLLQLIDNLDDNRHREKLENISENDSNYKLSEKHMGPVPILNDSLHCVYIARGFDDYYWLAEGLGLREKFDVVIIDVNLEHADAKNANKVVQDDGIEEFKKKAGIYIYYDLLKQGFQDEYLFFITGNAINVLDEFKKTLDIYYLSGQNYYTKGTDDNWGYPGLNRELVELRRSPGIGLRRGIIEGCNYAINKLNKDETKTVFDVGIISLVSKDSLILYFNNIKKTLVCHENAYHLEYDYGEVIKNIVHIWESFDYQCREELKNKKHWVSINYTTILTQTRNYFSHSIVENQNGIDEKYVAYIFMLHMRALFDEQKFDMDNHEKLLLSLFQQDHYTKKVIETDVRRNYFARLQICLENNIPIVKDPKDKYCYYNNIISNIHKGQDTKGNKLERNSDIVTKSRTSSFIVDSCYDMFWCTWYIIEKPDLGINNKVQSELKLKPLSTKQLYAEKNKFMRKLSNSVYPLSFRMTGHSE